MATQMANQEQIEQMIHLMERQIGASERQIMAIEGVQKALTEGFQKTLTQLADGQSQLQEAIKELSQTVSDQSKDIQALKKNSDTITTKTDAMEYRQWYNSGEQKDCLRAMDQFARGTLWTLSKSQAKGVQSALEMGCSSYGELVFQCDKRRAEHQVVATHYSKALPEDDLWQTGCIAIRQPSVQQQLIQNGVPQTLLNQFSPGVALLEKIRDAPPMADTSGQVMSNENVQQWEGKVLFNQRAAEACDGWASASQVSMEYHTAEGQNQNIEQDSQMNQADQVIEDSQL